MNLGLFKKKLISRIWQHFPKQKKVEIRTHMMNAKKIVFKVWQNFPKI
jgi:hypothetical protein